MYTHLELGHLLRMNMDNAFQKKADACIHNMLILIAASSELKNFLI